MRKIIHVDMDAFFVAVEIRDNPKLKGQCVAVGGSPTARGVIATANYEARKYGVHSAMSSAIALRKCPHLIFVRGNFDKYKKVSEQIHEIFQEFTELIEPLSLDEAYLDVSHYQSASHVAKSIRSAIWETCHLTASAGIAPNKFLAKVASDWRKPNGQFTIAPSQVDDFVKELSVKKIPGIGPKSYEKLKSKKIETCFDLQSFEKWQLQEMFGKWGDVLYERCRGQDHRPVQVNRIRKSLSVERTFEKDLVDFVSFKQKLQEIYALFVSRYEKKQVSKEEVKGHFLKIKFQDFQVKRFDRVAKNFPSFDDFFYLYSYDPMIEKKGIRLLGLGVKLRTASDETYQLSLFC